jgi:hypothetical protein
MADKEKQELRIQDADFAEIYCNQIVSTIFHDGAMHVTLGVRRIMTDKIGETPTPGTLPTVHVTGRIVLSPSAAIHLVNNLKTTLDMAAGQPSGPVRIEPLKSTAA